MKKTYYVYHLIDPRDGCAYYVGKGSGDRWRSHFQPAALKRDTNRSKVRRIRAVIAAGFEPRDHVLVLPAPSEEEAFRREVATIAKLGRNQLCNIADGGYGWGGRRPKRRIRKRRR